MFGASIVQVNEVSSLNHHVYFSDSVFAKTSFAMAPALKAFPVHFLKQMIATQTVGVHQCSSSLMSIS